MVFRLAKISDYKSFLESEKIAWEGTGISTISEKQFSSWLEVFPEGVFVAEENGKICAHHCVQITNFSQDNNINWNEITDFGFIKKTHNLEGNVFYGVSISSSVRGAGMKLFANSIKELAKKFDHKEYFGVCRIPGFRNFLIEKNQFHKKTVNSYTEAVVSKKIKDRVLSSFLSVEGVKFIRVIPDYFKDYQSMNYGVLISFINPRSKF